MPNIQPVFGVQIGVYQAVGMGDTPDGTKWLHD